MDSQQRFYLDVMGIQLYERRDLPVEEEVKKISPPVEAVTAEAVAKAAPQPATAAPAGDEVPAWFDEAPPADESGYLPEEAEIDESSFISNVVEPKLPDVAGLDWPALQQRIVDCTACPELVANRSQTVFGVGNRQADWMVIGEAPGADEDKQGEPFVGKAGQLLNAMLHALGLKREQVYIANVLKCRPPNNRDPKPEEASACEAFLKRQIELVQPKVILVVGRIAAQNLLKVDTPIGKLRGTVLHYGDDIPVVVTYHPAYLLRSPSEKSKSWADLCLARRCWKDKT